MRLLSVALVLAVTVAHAEEISAQDLAKVTREMKKASDAVAKKYGDSKSLSSEERKAMMSEQTAAQRAVLDKNNLDGKDVARATAKNGKEVDAAAKAMDAKEAEAAKKSTGPAAAPAAAPAAGGNSDANEAAAMDKARGLGQGKK